MKNKALLVPLVAFAYLAPVLTGCSGEGPREPLGPIDSPELGIRLARLPSGFQTSSSSGPDLHLLRSDGTRLTVTERPVDQAFTLLDLAKEQEQIFIAAPDGEFLGARELVAPFGPAYTARGRYSDGDQKMEESYAFVLRPDASGVITLLYRYPAGEDSKERVEELLLVLGELEQLMPQ